MRITSKGQVTIPLAIRQKAGLWPNTEVSFTLSRGVVVLRKVAGADGRGRQLVEHLRGKATARMSQIMALTRR
jgi:AbrB family looped-hinge helix DNA binding protein